MDRVLKATLILDKLQESQGHYLLYRIVCDVRNRLNVACTCLKAMRTFIVPKKTFIFCKL